MVKTPAAACPQSAQLPCQAQGSTAAPDLSSKFFRLLVRDCPPPFLNGIPDRHCQFARQISPERLPSPFFTTPLSRGRAALGATGFYTPLYLLTTPPSFFPGQRLTSERGRRARSFSLLPFSSHITSFHPAAKAATIPAGGEAGQASPPFLLCFFSYHLLSIPPIPAPGRSRHTPSHFFVITHLLISPPFFPSIPAPGPDGGSSGPIFFCTQAASADNDFLLIMYGGTPP